MPQVKEETFVDVSPTADWIAAWTAEQAEHELENFKFHGPGVYFIKGDSILVIPVIGLSKTDSRPLWKQSWPKDTMFRFYVYNGRDISQMLNTLVYAPTRSDDR